MTPEHDEELTREQLLAELRRVRAELAAMARRGGRGGYSAQPDSAAGPASAEHLLHELQVHQLELEMQNRELREAQAQLEETRSRYADLFDFAPVGYCTLDQRGLIQTINLTGAAMLGVERVYLAGKRLAAHLVPAHREVLEQHVRACFQGEHASAELALLPTRGRGATVVEVVSQPVRDAATARVVACRTALIDVTERRRAEDERAAVLLTAQRARAAAERANREKDEFLARVAHELRTPLASLLMWVEVLRAGLGAGAGAPDAQASMARALDAVEQSGQDLSRLIGDLLDTVRGAAGKMRVERAPLEPGPTLAPVVDAMRAEAAEQGIELVTALDASGVGMVRGDADRLRQVLSNLLSNAIRFTPAGGRIDVRLTQVGDQARLVVRDTGLGIAPDALPRIFDPFFQAEAGATRGHGGLGLGLSIAQQIVELHAGTLHAASDGPGKGATFTVALPVWQPDRADATADDARARQPDDVDDAARADLAGVRVLVVDDDARTREGFALVLAHAGAEVRAVGTAAEALAQLAQWRPDVLLSDLAMHPEDGWSLIRRVRALSPAAGGRTPAAVVTAHASPDDRRRALAAGFALFLEKPVAPRALCDAAARLARRNEP